MGDESFATLVIRLEDAAYDLGEYGPDQKDLVDKIESTKAAMFAHVASLRAAVRAADAMADAVSKLGGIADMPWSREYVALREFLEARAKCGEVT